MEVIKKILVKGQQTYWSGIGMCLYLIKHLHPNLANVTRLLSKANDAANPSAWKELLDVIKYMIDTKNLLLKIKPTGNSDKPWEIVCFSSSNYAGDPVSRQSISGFILYVLGILISWLSKLQKSVSLSISEVKYIAFSKAV